MIFCCSVQFQNLNNFEMVLSDQMIWKVQIYHPQPVENTMIYIPKGIFGKSFFHGEPKIH